VQAIDLPFVDASEPGLAYLLLPGYDREAYQGIQFEVLPQQGVMTVYCYESGYEENAECEGIVYPIALSSSDRELAREMETLRIVDPETIQPDEVGEDDFDSIQEAYNSD
jgi:hypothetical protein